MLAQNIFFDRRWSCVTGLKTPLDESMTPLLSFSLKCF